MKRITIILFTLSLISFSFNYSHAQESKPDYVKDIHDGALFFRMKTNLKKMQALRDANNQKEAEDLKTETAASIERWKDAFRTHYNFGKVYFFNDYDGYSIQSGVFDGKIFDLNGKVVNGFDGPVVVIGIDQTENLDIDGLILLDQDMNQLPKNTPNFISAYGAMRMKKRTEAEMVINLNESLHNRFK